MNEQKIRVLSLEKFEMMMNTFSSAVHLASRSSRHPTFRFLTIEEDAQLILCSPQQCHWKDVLFGDPSVVVEHGLITDCASAQSIRYECRQNMQDK